MNEEAAVRQTLAEYYSAFSTLDVNSAVDYFEEPAMLINPEGIFAASTHADLAAAFTPVMESLREQGYGGSELEVQRIAPLGSAAYSVTGTAVRRKVDGSELQRVGISYILRKADGAWAIAVLIMHGKDQPPEG